MIDYCTILFDERERILFPLHINSLRHYMPGVFNIKVSVRPEDSGAIALCEKFGVEALPHPIYTQSPGKVGQGLSYSSFDHANRLDLLMKACTSDWVILSHMDVVWTGNMILRAKSFMTDEYGVLGHYPHGSIAVNRKAYGECHAGFWHYRFRGWFDESGPNPYIRLFGMFGMGGMQDPVPFTEIVVPSVDVGCMLEIEMQSYTYKFVRDAVAHYHHIGGGSYHGRGGVVDFFKEPMTEEVIAGHKVVDDNVQRALVNYAMFK